MSGKTKVGYMGVPFSNTWEKAREFVQEMGWDAELVDLMCAKDTLDALDRGDVDYGVVAYTNNLAGTVQETAEAMKGRVFEVIAKGGLQVHHCVFAKSGDAKIDTVNSHIHALKQCERNLKRLYPDAKLTVSKDTAYSAELLAEGKLSDSTAVLCRRSAGEHWGLVMLYENIEDRSDNFTQFVLLRKPRPSPDIPADGAGIQRGETVVSVNGKEVDVSEGESVLNLLMRLGFTAGRFAVEIDGRVVPRSGLSGYFLQGKERIEVVGLVGGG